MADQKDGAGQAPAAGATPTTTPAAAAPAPAATATASGTTTQPAAGAAATPATPTGSNSNPNAPTTPAAPLDRDVTGTNATAQQPKEGNDVGLTPETALELARGNHLEFEKRRAGATQTELKILDEAMERHRQESAGRAGATANANVVSEVAAHLTDAAKQVIANAGQSDPNAVRFSGRAGGPFNIDGAGFGNAGGTLLIGGQPVATSRWSDNSIKGTLPADAKEGPVEIRANGGRTFNTTFGRTPTKSPGEVTGDKK